MTASLERVPCTVVTGFLGAGKTTLIRNILENAGGRRLAIIVNEFGDVGIDGEILKGCGVEACPEENIVELANGCICCTVADDFVPALDQILSRSPRVDHILIETSGLALPKPLVQALVKIRYRGWTEIFMHPFPRGIPILPTAAEVTAVPPAAYTSERLSVRSAHAESPRAMDSE